MKRFSYFLTFLVLAIWAAVTDLPAQKAPEPAQGGEIYHVNISKAAPGKAAQLADSLKKQDPSAPMPGHFLVLRHLDGDSWDYVTIEHLGPKATVDANLAPPAPAVRDLRAWHTDTFVIGPPWKDFAAAMGIGVSNTSGSIYVVGLHRSLVGHRDQLEALLRQRPEPGNHRAGAVVMTHLEGANWNFLTLERYNSWQDVAANESNDRVQLLKGQGGWFEMREHSDYHTDTFTDRIAP